MSTDRLTLTPDELVAWETFAAAALPSVIEAAAAGSAPEVEGMTEEQVIVAAAAQLADALILERRKRMPARPTSPPKPTSVPGNGRERTP